MILNKAWETRARGERIHDRFWALYPVPKLRIITVDDRGIVQSVEVAQPPFLVLHDRE
jgi:hypothetical protein